MRLTRRILGIALFVALLVGGWRFAAENAQVVSVHYLLGSIDQVPVWQVLFCAFLAGVVVTGVLALVQTARLRLEARRYRKAVRGLEAEVHQLRNLPLASDEAEPGGPPGDLASLGGLGRGS
jgi:uncharacterized integral membrane protein